MNKLLANFNWDPFDDDDDYSDTENGPTGHGDDCISDADEGF